MSKEPIENKAPSAAIGTSAKGFFRRKKTTLLVILATVLLGAAVYGVMFITNQANDALVVTQDQSGGAQELPRVTVVFNEAQKIAEEKTPDEAVAYLRDEASKAGSDTEKARILGVAVMYASIDQSVAAQKTALEYQLESYGLEPTEASAAIIGEMYAKIGDKANAIKYFKLAIEHAKANNNQAPGEVDGNSYAFYENEITYLESGE